MDSNPNGRPPWPPSNPNPQLNLAPLSRRLLDISFAAGSSLQCNFQNVQNAFCSSLYQGSWHWPTLVLGSFAVVRCHRKSFPHCAKMVHVHECDTLRVETLLCTTDQCDIKRAKLWRRQLVNVFLAFSLVRSCGKLMFASFMMQNSWDILRSLVVLNQTRFLNVLSNKFLRKRDTPSARTPLEERAGVMAGNSSSWEDSPVNIRNRFDGSKFQYVLKHAH